MSGPGSQLDIGGEGRRQCEPEDECTKRGDEIMIWRLELLEFLIHNIHHVYQTMLNFALVLEGDWMEVDLSVFVNSSRA